MKLAGFLLFLIGLCAMLGLVGYYGFSDVIGALAVAAEGIIVVALFHCVPLVTDTVAWRRLLPPQHRGRLRDLLWMRWVSESVKNLLPVAQVGGDLVRARLAAQRGVPAADATASIVADITTSVLTLIAFGALGAWLLSAANERESGVLLVALAVSALLVCIFYALQRARLFSRLAGLAARTVGLGTWEPVLGSASALDQALDAVYARRGDVLVSCAWASVAWILGAGEVWLALQFMHVPVGIADALIFESLVQAVRGAAFPIPGALGVQEGALVALGLTLGISGDTALALSLIKRARELLFGLPGLLVWQIAEGRHFFRRRARARADSVQRPW